MVENDLQDDHFSIELNSGKYAGIRYRYSGVRLSPNQFNVDLSFGYIVEQYPISFEDVDLATDLEFTNTLGDILVELLSSSDLHTK